MNNNPTKRIWIYLSAFGVCFAFLSWMQDIFAHGFWWKGTLAALLGFVLYRAVIRKV